MKKQKNNQLENQSLDTRPNHPQSTQCVKFLILVEVNKPNLKQNKFHLLKSKIMTL
jgi:hypothetical protein